jgi:DNA-directed RNA polymerase specialized sigma24 family protein
VRKHFWRKFLPLDNNPGILEMPDVYGRAEANEDKDILYAALAKLSAKERSCILLFEIGNFSIEEIRIIQGEKSLSAIKSRLSRAFKTQEISYRTCGKCCARLLFQTGKKILTVIT